MTTIETQSAAATVAVGRQLTERLAAGDVVALHGELGAGKTCLVKGIAQGFGVAADVTSPTFTLIHEYRGGRLPLYHLDLYRLESVAQALAIGVEEYLGGDGVAVIEWAEKIAALLPEQTIEVRIAITGESRRRITIG